MHNKIFTMHGTQKQLDDLNDDDKAVHAEIIKLLHQGLDGKLKSMVEESFDQVQSIVNRSDRDHFTVLHDAARRRLLGCVKVLVEFAHADVNAKTSIGMTPLHFAAKYGEKASNDLGDENEDLAAAHHKVDDELIAYLISKGAWVNERDQNGLTPLHYAASRNRLRSVRQLIRERAEIECVDNEQMTPLLMAVKNQNIRVTDFLLQADADCTCTDIRNCTIFHYASQAPNALPIQRIYEQVEKSLGPDEVLSLLNQANKKQETPLHWSIINRSDAIFEFLLAKGADINVKTLNEETALHLAAHEGNDMLITTLIKRGAKVDVLDAEGETPLFKAVQGGHEYAVHVLLERGANVNQSNSAHQTPLLVAAKLGKDTVCEILISNDADILARDKNWNTALTLAIAGKHYEVVQTLLKDEKGRNLLEMEDPLQNSPIHTAVQTGSLKITNCLLNFGANILAKNAFEHTPIHVAAIYGRYRILLRLLDISPMVAYERDEDGNYAVHLAAKHGFVQVLRKLLEQTRQVNEKNGFGWTPLTCAAAYNQVECVKLLLDREAKVNTRDKSNITPLFVASQRGYTDVVNLLIKRGACPTIRVIETHERFPGWTALDIAVDGRHFETVKSIIQSDSGIASLSNVTIDHNNYWNTPLRRMIQEMPEAAELVLSRCIITNDLPKSSPNYTITFDFRYLKDDEILDQFEKQINEPSESWYKKHSSGPFAEPSKFPNAFFPFADPSEEPMLGADHKLLFKPDNAHVLRQIRRKRSIPPIELMVKSGREELLHHPLIIALLAYKWARLNVLYYVSLVTYALFLALFTSFMLLTEAPYMLKNETMQSSREVCLELQQNGAKAYCYHIGVPKYGTLILSVISVLLELLQLIRSRLRYFNPENLLEFSVFLLSLLTTIDTSLCMMKTGLREDWQWGCGTVGIFLAWINLLLFVRRGPVFGIFVIMFVSVTVTFAKVFFVFSPFLIAFALAFHALLVNQNAFRTMQNALIKTFAMTIGELDMGDHVFERFSNAESDKQVHYETLTYILFIGFLVLMCIVMMNLLVGLAVDDIKVVQRKATLKRQEMKIQLLLSAEAVLSRFGHLVDTPKQYKYQPNAKRAAMDQVFHNVYTQATKTVRNLEATVEGEKQLDMEAVDNRLEAIQRQTLEIGKLLNRVVDRLNTAPYTGPLEMPEERLARNTYEICQPLMAAAGPVPVLRARHAVHAQPRQPVIERLQIDEDSDHEPYRFGAKD